MTDDLTRRDVVAGIGSVAAAGSLAGCGSDSGTTGDGNESDGGAGGNESDGGTEGGDGTTTVEMTNDLVFDPEEVTVSPGTTVVWDNVGNVAHSVTAYEEDIPEDAEYWASGDFDSEQAARDAYPDSGDVGGGETWEHTFETTGTHEYFCIPHEGSMVGTVVVEES